MNQDDQEIDLLRRQLQAALPPCRDVELRADLWPRMLRRLEDAPPRFGWFEAVLASLIALSFVAFPQLISVMLFNL